MSTPTLLDTGRFNGALHGISLSGGWRIPSSNSKDIIWNIVWAYLNSFSLSNENELTERIRRLKGDGNVSPGNKRIKKSVKRCNPFLSINEYFNDGVMKALVNRFKNRVEDYIKNDEKLFRNTAKNFRYLEASSKLLSCNIVLISFPFEDKITDNVCPAQIFPNERTIYQKHILILVESKPTNDNEYVQNELSFCIPKEAGIEKQREALRYILERERKLDNKKKIIQEICNLPDITENFLISLLKNDFGQVIPSIYKSPYVISKLADSGFETDPRTKDRAGKTAFFHAFKTGKSGIVSLLYDHAANACLQTKASVRSPNPEIVENLLSLKGCLKQLGKDLESEDISEKSRCVFRDLCRFNEFQTEICKRINDIRIKVNCYDQIEKEYEAKQRKYTILMVLKTYKTYFDYVNREQESSLETDNNISLFKEFYNHKGYFDKLDFSSAVMFFDNLFLLKERLKLSDNAYLDVESKFFLFIFCRKYLERYEKENCFYFVSRWITFQERLSLQKQMRTFKEILEKTELSKDNIVNNIPETAVQTLTNLTEIYGQFFISRLQHYSNATIGLNLKDLKSILVIERCLQVLGESCKESDFNSVQRILTLALPKDFLKHLKQIRNHFAHVKTHEILYRNNLQQDVDLFKGIQYELHKLNILFLPIYSVHKYIMGKFLLSHHVKSIRKARKSILEENLLKVISPSSAMEANHLSISTYSSQSQRKQILDDLRTFLRKKNVDLNSNGQILDENTISPYKHAIQNIISAIGEVLKKEVPLREKAVELESHFWCLENILSYITTDRNLAKYRGTLMPMVKDRKSLFTELREQFLDQAYTSNNSVIGGTPVVEGEIAEAEDTCDDRQQIMNAIDTFEIFGVFVDLTPSSSSFSNENDNNGFSHEKHESSETSLVKNEINGENLELLFLENLYDGNNTQETTDTIECIETVDLHENIEDPETIILREEKDLPFTEGINMTSHGDWFLANVYHDYSVNAETEDPEEMMDVKRKKFIEDVTTFLHDYKKISDTIFQEFPYDLKENFHFKHIEKYCLILKGRTFLSEKEKDFIARSVPSHFRNVPEQKRKIKALLNGGNSFTEEIEAELSKLNLKNQEIKEIKENIKCKLNDESYRIIENARDYFLQLKERMQLNKINKSEYELLCEKLKMPAEAQSMLSKIVDGQNRKVPGNKFNFFRNRIKLLKKILIDEYSSIQNLWKSATTPQRKLHVKEKIVQLYLNDAEIQASSETLLFDCMSIFEQYKLDHLWKKTANLLSGINLRNVLAHGHPLLESLGRLLDPCDLPSELVEKMLKLISDENVIHCIQLMLQKKRPEHSSFMELLQDERFKNFSERILECDHYYEYAPLLAHC